MHTRIILFVLLSVAAIATGNPASARPPRYRTILLEKKAQAEVISTSLMFPLTYTK